MSKRIIVFRILTPIFGLVMLLGFFLFPILHSKANQEVEDLTQGLQEMVGGEEESEMPLYGKPNLTAFGIVSTALNPDKKNEVGNEEGGPSLGFTSVGWAAAQYLLPVFFAVMLIAFGIIGKKVGGIGSIAAGVLGVVFYLLQILMYPKSETGIDAMDEFVNSYNFKFTFWQYLLIGMAVLGLVMGILELVFSISYDKKVAASAYGSDPYSSGSDGYYSDNGYDDGYGGGFGTEAAGFGTNGGMQAQGALIGIKGEYRGATVPINDGARITIGRSAGNCNLVISNPAVSRIHCYVSYYADRNIYTVMDVSKFGVFDTGGQAIEKNTEVPMGSGDEIHIGRSHNVFRLG